MRAGGARNPVGRKYLKFRKTGRKGGDFSPIIDEEMGENKVKVTPSMDEMILPSSSLLRSLPVKKVTPFPACWSTENKCSKSGDSLGLS